MNDIPLEQLNFEHFAALLHSRFLVHLTATDSVALELMEAIPLPATRPATTPNPAVSPTAFSLIFTGSDQQPLPQSMYRFEQERMGAFPLFIVPIRQEQGKRYYEAVFNRTKIIP